MRTEWTNVTECLHSTTDSEQGAILFLGDKLWDNIHVFSWWCELVCWINFLMSRWLSHEITWLFSLEQTHLVGSHELKWKLRMWDGPFTKRYTYICRIYVIDIIKYRYIIYKYSITAIMERWLVFRFCNILHTSKIILTNLTSLKCTF